MKDLKHLIYFENLLQEANNDLVQQARKDGKKAIAYTCYHIPEVLLNLDNCFSVRLRAENRLNGYSYLLFKFVFMRLFKSFA